MQLCNQGRTNSEGPGTTTAAVAAMWQRRQGQQQQHCPRQGRASFTANSSGATSGMDQTA